MSVSTDVDNVTNSTFGELIGDANVSALSEWIVIAVPEMSTILLMGISVGAVVLISVCRRNASRA